jgi:hypothetical protein
VYEKFLGTFIRNLDSRHSFSDVWGTCNVKFWLTPPHSPISYCRFCSIRFSQVHAKPPPIKKGLPQKRSKKKRSQYIGYNNKLALLSGTF